MNIFRFSIIRKKNLNWSKTRENIEWFNISNILYIAARYTECTYIAKIQQ